MIRIVHVSFHKRNHSREFWAGIWKLATNGLQFFAGNYAMTVCWRAK